MESQKLGSILEDLTKDFFYYLFDELNIQVNNHWIQKAGFQYGFDVGFEIALLNNDFFKRKVFIECKNYSKSRLEQSQMLTKLMQFDRSDYKKKDSIFIFLSPKANLSKSPQDCNPVQLEDYFNSSYKFKVIILTPNNRIKDILSLKEDIYRTVYENEIFTVPDKHFRKTTLDYFAKLFYSKGELPRFHIYSERHKYMEEAEGSENNSIYVSRTITSDLKSFVFSEQSLLDAIRENDIVLLLGEPGSGKTTELKKAANYFREKISTLEVTPIFISLSNIGNFKKIESLLPEGWDASKRIVLFLDAFDEFDFKDKLCGELESLMEYKEISIKAIISCRKYAYSDELESLVPAKLILNGFNPEQGFEFLNRNFGILPEQFSLIDSYRFKDVLSDPFMLGRLGLFFEINSRMPALVSELYNSILDELSLQDASMYCSVALTLELTRSTSISMEELRSLFGIGVRKAQNLDFLEKSFDKKSFKFRHKNYQEFFAAAALSNLEVDKIKKFIVIDGTDKTHPALFNTITFLINIIEFDTHESLLSWMVEHEPEFLFKAESSRVKKYRKYVFQNYFMRQCIEKSLWIDSGNLALAKEIAEFGDCFENVEFLLEIIRNYPNQVRVIVSAVKLLHFFTLEGKQRIRVKDIFLGCLEEESTMKTIKAAIISCITSQGIAEEDRNYLLRLFAIFKKETNKEINSALLFLIRKRDDIDSFFSYVRDEFSREFNFAKRDFDDRVQRGNGWLLKELILKLDNPDYFIELAVPYLVKSRSLNADQDFRSEAVRKVNYFGEKDKSFIVRLLSGVGQNLNFFRRDGLLRDMIATSCNLVGAVEYLLNNCRFHIVRHLIAEIADKSVLGLVRDHYVTGKFGREEMLAFRDALFYHNADKKKHIEFEKMASLAGVVLASFSNADGTIHAQKEQNEQRLQKNFDIYFEEGLLLKEVESIFKTSSLEYIDSERIMRLEDEWYEQHGILCNEIDTSLQLLKEFIIDNEGPVTFVETSILLDNDLVRFSKICQMLLENKESEDKIIISGAHQAQIIKWTQKTAQEISFDRIISLVNEKQFLHLRDYDRLDTVIKFHQEINFKLPKEFLLNAIEFYEINSFEDDNDFSHLKAKIADDGAFNKKIVENIKKGELYSRMMEKHVFYALDSNLKEAMPEVREHLLRKSSGFRFDAVAARYFEITDDVEFLKECCQDVAGDKCWASIKILAGKKIEIDFCIRKAMEFLDSKEGLSFYCFDALSILFEFERPEALVYYYNLLVRGERNLSFTTSYSIANYEILRKLFHFIFGENCRQSGHNHSIEFLKSYISNLSHEDANFFKTQEALLGIREEVRDERHDTEIFYINLLIDISKISHYAFKSKPMLFSEAYEKVEELQL